jgi:Na+/proline symporter
MNVFQLAVVLAPLAGCAAAVRSAAGHGSGFVIGCAVAGLVIGAAVSFGPVSAATWVWSRVHDPHVPPDRPEAIEWTAGLAVVLYAAFSPIIAWFVSAYAISRL